MASNIKGITVEIGGDTTKLDKALKEVNASSRSLQGELKSVDKALKLDPTNVNLLKQKQDLLKESIVQTSDKLKILKSTQEQVQEQFNKGEITENQYRAVQREIENTEIKLKSLTKESKEFGTSVSESLISAKEKFNEFGNKATEIGKKTSVVSGAVGLALGASAKSAIDFESAFTGVVKTVDATDEELAKLKDGLLEMSKSMPESASDIAQVAESAGQLGIKTENIESFTKSMVMLGDATNMSSDQAATSLARFANITGMSQTNFDRLGSVLVELGNNFATTESEITDMAMRLAGAGHQIGMSEAQIMGLSAGLSSVGIAAEAGGSAFSKVMVNMQLATEIGGEDLEDFANVAGMSGEQFQKAFKEDASGALLSFIKGLSETEKNGTSAIKTLDDMGITEVRMRDALLRASSANDTFTDAISLGTQAWEENTALAKEAETRYATTESQLQMLKNQIAIVAITIGEQLLPIINSVLSKIGDWVNKFSNLSDTSKKIITIIGLLVAALGPSLIIIGKISLGIGSMIGLYSKIVAAKVINTAATIAETAATEGATIAQGGLNLAFLACPLTWIIAGIVVLVATFVILWNKCESFRNFWINLWETIKTTFSVCMDVIINFFTVTIPTAWNNFIAFLQGIPTYLVSLWTSILSSTTTAWNNISTFFSNLWISITEIFNIAISTIIGFMTSNFSGAIDGVKQIFDGFSTYLNGIWEVIKTIFLGTILIIIDIVTGNFSALKTDTENIFNNLKGAFSQIWEGIKLIFNGALQVIHNIVSTIWNSIKTETENLWNGIKSFFEQLWTSIQTSITNAWNGFKNIISTTCINISNEVNSIWNGILTFFAGLPSKLYTYGVNAFTSLRNGMNTILSTLGSVVSNGFSSAISFITSLPSQAYTWGVDFISGIVKGIKASIGKVKDAVEDVADTIRSYLHFSVPDIGPLTDYETYMPDFMQGLANGINKSKHLVTSAIGGLATEMSVGINPNAYNSTLAKSSNSNIAQKQDVYLALNIDNFNNNNNEDINELSEKLLFNIKRGL